MSNYQQKYCNGGVDHQTIADEIMSVIGRLDALEGKLEALTPWDEQGRRVSAIYPGETCKGAAQDEITPEYRAAMCKTPDVKYKNYREWPIRSLMNELAVIGAGLSGHKIPDIWAEIERRIFQARREGYDERRCSEAKPAPEPTSEPKPCYLVDAVTGEPRSRLFAEYGDAHEVFGYNPATPAQIRAEAVRLGLLDAERQKVAEAFLHAALDSMAGKEDSYKDTAGAFLRESRREGVIHGEWLEGMASVLEAAAKGEK
jgi:hypothetical protein